MTWFVECNCDSRGSESESCNADTGKCTCHIGFSGIKCDQDFYECEPGIKSPGGKFFIIFLKKSILL